VYDSERQGWRLEGGLYHIEVGGSSVALPLKLEINVAEDPV